MPLRARPLKTTQFSLWQLGIGKRGQNGVLCPKNNDTNVR